uniref:Uncharacterized protein n=1 Tax=Magallana gigas TaxID=29159 RepID=A0A8W8J2A9_MAGGI
MHSLVSGKNLVKRDLNLRGCLWARKKLCEKRRVSCCVSDWNLAAMAWVWPEDAGQKSQTKFGSTATWPTPGEKALSPAKSVNETKKSERQEYDFMHSNNITTLTAPFGTNDTPNISYKIIGSKPVHVIESLQSHRPQDDTLYTGPRIHNLDGVTIKPNQVNPRVLNEKVKGYYSAQQADPSEDTLRLIAAMCVVPKVQNMVNYEDVITFLNEAIRLTQNGWRRFVDFLERVQPAKTGLEITYNKRPLEYAKQYPQPVESWPRARESPRYSSPPPANQYGQFLKQGLESNARGDSWESKLIQLAGQLYRVNETRYRSSDGIIQIRNTTHNPTLFGDAAEETFALTDPQYRHAEEELLIEDETITGDKTTHTRIKISVRTVVSTITKMSGVPQKESSVPNADDGIISQKCAKVFVKFMNIVV